MGRDERVGRFDEAADDRQARQHREWNEERHLASQADAGGAAHEPFVRRIVDVHRADEHIQGRRVGGGLRGPLEWHELEATSPIEPLQDLRRVGAESAVGIEEDLHARIPSRRAAEAGGM